MLGENQRPFLFRRKGRWFFFIGKDEIGPLEIVIVAAIANRKARHQRICGCHHAAARQRIDTAIR
jgi:hypothetical protein